MATVKDDRSIGQLLSDLATETTVLVRKEIELAKAEISEKVSNVGIGVAALAAGGLVFFAGFLVLLDAAVYGLGRLLNTIGFPAVEALIVAIGTMVVGIIILMVGRNYLKAENLTPSRTAESLRRDKDMVKEHVQ
jgi:hypothetical protein